MRDTATNVIFESRTSQRGYIDVSLDKADIRQGQTVTPFRQALNYANSMPYSQHPRYIITCNEVPQELFR